MADAKLYDSETGQPVDLDAEFVPPSSPTEDEIVDGVIVDGTEGEEATGHRILGSGYIEKPPDTKGRDQQPKSGPPRVDEWQDFFSRVIIRAATDWYIGHVFSDIDEDLLSDDEVARINIAPEERDRIARPFSELSNKSKFMRKHGRTIIASADSFDSVITLGIWYRRVNRIAGKYHRLQGTAPKQRRREPREKPQDERLGSSTASQNGHGTISQAWINPGTG